MAKRKWTKAQKAALSRKMKAVRAARGKKPKAVLDIETAPGDLLVATIADDGGVTYHLNAPGYDALAAELSEAFAQSAHGKGKERHANGRPFDRQPILELGRLYGPGFATGQSAKKAQEALGMLRRGERERCIHELHGAIVYLAAAASLIREGGEA